MIHTQDTTKLEPTWSAGDVQLYLGDCLDILPQLEAGSVDAILTDVPYGTTACAWDEIIPFEPMWREVKRMLKPRGVFVTTASQPFTSKLVMSNLDQYKYCWYWYKNNPTGFQFATSQPMRAIEEIAVFYGMQPTYNPQKMKSRIADRKVKNGMKNGKSWSGRNDHKLGVTFLEHPLNEDVNPWNVLEIPIVSRAKGTMHPTQKPVALYAYLARTYTNEGDTVCDFTMGSGTTLVACVQTGRRGIGIEIDPGYFEIAVKRIKEAQLQMRLPI